MKELSLSHHIHGSKFCLPLNAVRVKFNILVEKFNYINDLRLFSKCLLYTIYNKVKQI